jgi:hypothetical protein
MPRSKLAIVNAILVSMEREGRRLILSAGTRTKMGRLARHQGYTITVLVEELVKRAERRATTKLTGRALKGTSTANRRIVINKHGYAITMTAR